MVRLMFNNIYNKMNITTEDILDGMKWVEDNIITEEHVQLVKESGMLRTRVHVNGEECWYPSGECIAKALEGNILK
jgi:hypothetical protein